MMNFVSVLLSDPLMKEVFTRVVSDGRVRMSDLLRISESMGSNAEDVQTVLGKLELENLIKRTGGSAADEMNIVYPTSDGLQVGKQIKLSGPTLIRSFKK